MKSHQQFDARRFQRAIERWEKEGGRISMEASRPPQDQAKRKPHSSHELTSISEGTKQRRIGNA
jgi:hypothetical protein